MDCQFQWGISFNKLLSNSWSNLNDFNGRPPWNSNSDRMLKNQPCSTFVGTCVRKKRISCIADFGQFWPTGPKVLRFFMDFFLLMNQLDHMDQLDCLDHLGHPDLPDRVQPDHIDPDHPSGTRLVAKMLSRTKFCNICKNLSTTKIAKNCPEGHFAKKNMIWKMTCNNSKSTQRIRSCICSHEVPGLFGSCSTQSSY